MEKICENCKNWQKRNLPNGWVVEHGSCNLLGEVVKTRGLNLSAQQIWPLTPADFGCNKFEIKSLAELPVGREMDRAVAEALGWYVEHYEETGKYVMYNQMGGPCSKRVTEEECWEEIPQYSNYVNSWTQIMEFMVNKEFSFNIIKVSFPEDGYDFQVKIERFEKPAKKWLGNGRKVSEAACRALLRWYEDEGK